MSAEETIKAIVARRKKMKWYQKAWYRVRRWSPVDSIREVWYGLENLWAYKSLIWSDRDWDWVYLYKLMEFKMRRMAKLQRNYGISVDAEIYATQLEEAAELLRKLHEDDYPYGTGNYSHACHQQKRDLRKFCWKFYKESMSWWD